MTTDGAGWTLIAAIHRASWGTVDEPDHWFVAGQNSGPLIDNTEILNAAPSSFGASRWETLISPGTVVARFDFHAGLDYATRRTWFKSVDPTSFSSWFDDDAVATSVCLDPSLTLSCDSGRIRADAGQQTYMEGMSLTDHGYAADADIHLHQDTSDPNLIYPGVCSATFNWNGNAWPDGSVDGHWGNGLRIWLRE
jgi:hypothetical protein